MVDKVVHDDIYRMDYKEDKSSGVMHRKLTQPSEDIIMNRNAELRKNPGVIKDLPFGRYVGSIPENIYEMAKRVDPELGSIDKHTRQKALMRFLKTPMGKSCLVQEKM